MSPETGTEKINSLLQRYEEHLDRGEVLSAETLCEGCPEHLPEVSRRIEALRRFAAWDGPAATVESIGQCRVDEWVGSGAMGDVYKAFHTGIDRVVALKLLPPDKSFSSEAIARFNVELKALGKLGTHNNVVWCTDGGKFEGRHYLVMEFIDGKTLAELVGESGRLPVSQACAYARQAALGLQYIHDRGICHRDIKPSNLMVTRDGVVKVTDLGLALLQEPDDVWRPELTDSQTTIGTYHYMAPEQARNSHNVDARADIYSLGATLYKLLAGKAPFEGPGVVTKVEALAALLDDRPAPPIASRRPDVPADLARLIDRMISKDRDDRPTSAAKVADALESFTHENALAPPARKPANSSHARLLAIGPMLIVFTLGTVILWNKGCDRPPDGGDEPVVHKGAKDLDDLTRRVAAMVFDLGGRLDVMGGEEEIGSVDDLPRTSFRIDGIMISRNPRVNDDFLKKVSRLPGLSLLDLSECDVNDQGSSYIGKIQSLTYLDIKHASMTEKGFAALANLQSLETLKLSDTSVDDAALEMFRHQRRLRVLHLKHTGVTNRSMRVIGQWSTLVELDLRENGDIDDRGLDQLRSLAKLRVLWVEDTQVTPQGIARLKEALPACDIRTQGAP